MKAYKRGDRALKFVNRNIFGPFIGGVVLLVIGPVLVLQGLEGNWTEWTEYTFMVSIGSVLGLIGLFVAPFGPRVHTYIFDKEGNKIGYECKKLGRNRYNSYALDEASRIIVSKEIRRRRSGSSKTRRRSRTKVIYKYLLEFSNGSRIELGRKSRNNIMFAIGGAKTPAAINELSNFLDIPIEQFGMQEMFNQVKETAQSVFSGEMPEGMGEEKKPPPSASS